MKKLCIILLLLAFVNCIPFAANAQPGFDDEPEDVPVDVPIDGLTELLVFGGIWYGWTRRKKRQG